MIEFGVLGPLCVAIDGRPVAVPATMLQRLLTLLLCQAARPMRADALADALWGGAPPRTARKTLQVYLHRLRRTLGDESRVVFGPAGYQLVVAPEELDATEFDRLVSAAATARERGEPTGARARLDQALALWRGPAYADARDIPVVIAEAERLEESRLAAVEERIAIDLELGRHREVIGELAAAVAAQPYREQLRRLQMLALYRAGRQADALQVYRETRELLVTELGVEPMPELRELHRRVLGSDPELAAPVPADSRAPAGATAVAWHPPAPLADFVGRVAELDRIEAHVRASLAAELAPVVAISGLPGIGKTALGIAAARRQRYQFPLGQLYVDLHGHELPRHPIHVLHRFLRTIGVDAAAIPADLEEAADLYRARLSHEPRLVLLDNAASVAQVTPLLPPPECAVLVTSRRLLADLDGACFVALEPLPEPDAVELLARTAGRERVAEAADAARAIVHACGRLPLAVRIAGARPLDGAASLVQLAEQLTGGATLLDHLTSAERSVRASLQSAYDTLDEADRRLLRCLAVTTQDDFPAWVAGVGLALSTSEGEELLDRLVRASLVEPLSTDAVGQRRFRLHDVVRHFGAEQAERPDLVHERIETLTRVADALLTLAEEADVTMHSVANPAELVSVARVPAVTQHHLTATEKWFAIECPSIVYMVRLAAEAGLSVQCWGLVWNCETYLRKDARSAELIALGYLALEVAERASDTLGVACMSLTLAASYDLAGDAATGEPLGRRAVVEADALGHNWLRAEARTVLAGVHSRSGNTVEQGRLLAEAIDLYLASGELAAAGVKLALLGEIAAQAGDEAQAVARFEQSVALLRRANAPVHLAHGLRHLGRFRRDSGAPAEAADLFRECLVLLHDLDETVGELCLHTELALTLLDLDDLPGAADHVDRAVGLIERAANGPMYVAFARMGQGVLFARQGRDDEARATLTSVLPGLAVAPFWQATVLIELGRLHQLAGDQTTAEQARREAAAIAERIGARLLAERAAASGDRADLAVAAPGSP